MNSKWNNMVRLRWALLLLVAIAIASGAGAQSRLSDTDAAFVVAMAKQAAFAETLTAFCSEKNAQGQRQFQAALQDWQQRNQWSAIESGPLQQEMLPSEFDNLKAEVRNQLEAHRILSAMKCASLPQVLQLAGQDPSVKHARDIARIAAMPPAGAPPGATADRRADVTAVPPVVTTQAPAMQPSVAPDKEQAQASVGNAAPSQGNTPAGSPLEDVSFTPPAGWSMGKITAAGMTYLKEFPDKRRCIVTLAYVPLQGELVSGFKQALLTSFPGTDLTLKNVQEGRTPDGLPAVSTGDGGHLRGSRVFATLRAVGIAAPDKRLLIVEFLSTADVVDRLHAEPDFEATVRSVHIRGTRDTAVWDVLHPPAGSGGQRGLFWSNHLENQINPLGGMDLHAVRNYMLLLPSGQAYNKLPQNGHVLDMDFTSVCGKAPQHCGTYKVSGGSIHFIFPNEYGLLVDTTGKWTGKGGNWFGGDYVALPPVQAMRLDGRYTTMNYMSGNTATSSTGILSQHFIQFTRDGRYQQSGFASTTFSNENASGTVNSRQRGPVTGQYSIEGYTLTLQPDRGTVPDKYTLLFETVSPTAKAIWINDNTYLRDGSN